MKLFRLLPAVIVLGASLLVLKGTGLVHEANAQSADARLVAAPPATAVADKDVSGDDTETPSAAEVDVLSSLARRRTALDARDRDQDMRETVLAATEKRLDDKIAALKQIQAQIAQLLGQRDAEADKQMAALVKTYSAMKPKDAARIFDGLSDDVLIAVAQHMKSDALAPVLAAMNPSAAQKLTVKLASRLNLPDTVAVAPLQTVAAAGAASAPQGQPLTPAPTAPAPAPPAPAPAAPVAQSAPAQAVPAAPQPAPAKHG
ncbi:MAG: hypothetical protein JOZ13_17245 [Alphaproteobacteria bacterium]|nr:hypothetical protein [Alphaproteobacteria bacterium]